MKTPRVDHYFQLLLKVSRSGVWNARWLFYYLFNLKLDQDLILQLPNATILNFLPWWRTACNPGVRLSRVSPGQSFKMHPEAALAEIILHFSLQFVIQVACAYQDLTPAYNAFTVDNAACPVAFFMQPLQPHVRVWDSVSLVTLQVIGLGTFERGVGCLDFSKAVRWPRLLGVVNKLSSPV